MVIATPWDKNAHFYYNQKINCMKASGSVTYDGKTYSYKCRNYFDYLYKVARNEYDIGHQILHFHNINYLDKKALDQNSLEVMQHYWNSIKCYKFLLKNCHDPVILSTCEFELKMVQDAVNVLARTIISSDDTGLMMV